MIQIGAVVMASEEYYVHDSYGDGEYIYRQGDIGVCVDGSSVDMQYGNSTFYVTTDWNELPKDEYVD